jgi:hypothetical protein
MTRINSLDGCKAVLQPNSKCYLMRINPCKEWLSCSETRRPISTKHESFGYAYLEQHLTTYHSKIGSRLRYITELGTPSICTDFT